MQNVKKGSFYLVIIVLCAALCVTMGVISTKADFSANAETFTLQDEIVIGHITDTHYYPISYCYSGTDGDFRKALQTSSTKMWLESSTAFAASLATIRAKAPDYLVVSGDVAQDGEKQSHIEVANQLRNLQNELRVANPKFQIFVTLGNHDMYNPSVYDFSGDGVRKLTESITRLEATKIYSSLGFPDITAEEAAPFFGANAYVESSTASNIAIKYQYMTDSDYASRTDYDIGDNTYIAATTDGYCFVGLDEEESNATDGHVLSGHITSETMRFLSNNKPVTSNLIIGIAHHSIVPHWDLEEEITTGFIVKDWVNRADFLADYGMRYVFTGHQHANDTVSHISYNGNQIIDMESAANVSIGSGVKYATIERGLANGDTSAEKLYINIVLNKKISIAHLIDAGLITRDYLKVNKLEEFVNWEGKYIKDYSKYSQRRIYDNAVSGTLSSYLDVSIIDKLVGMVDGVLVDNEIPLVGDLLSEIAPDVGQLIKNLVEQVNLVVLKDYTYSGTNEKFVGKDNAKIFGFLEELVDKAVSIEMGKDTDVFEFAMYSFLAHCYGTNVESYDALPANIKEGFEKCISGEFVDTLFGLLLDKEEGLYFLLNGLLNSDLDLSKNISTKGVETFKSIFGLIQYTDFDISKLNLNDALCAALNSSLVKGLIAGISFDLTVGENGIMGILDGIVEKYLTASFKQNLGEIVYLILEAFGIDESFDGNETKTLIAEEGESYTFLSVAKEEIISVENGKLPSMLTVNFGSDPSSTMNFTWFTDKRVGDGVVQYMAATESFNAEKAMQTIAENDIYCYTMPLIDLGIWSQLGYNEMGRHTAELTQLKPNTTYYYRVGSASNDYWSEVYSFKTAPSDAITPFDILLVADLQGSTKSSYDRSAETFEKAGEVYKNGYDFIINLGDLIDNSKNMDQFNWAINSLQGYWAESPTVVVSGNHEDDYFEYDIEDGYELSSEDVITSEYNNLLLHYNFDLPTQDTQSGAYYSFDYSGVHFSVLNTNDIKNNKLGTKQFDWLVNDLKTTDKKIKVVAMHKSLYSTGSHSYDKEVIGMRAQLVPIFEEYGVQLVLGGHDHTYSETYFVDGETADIDRAADGSYKLGEGSGTLYITLGTFGEKFYNYVENPDVPSFFGKDLHSPTLTNPTFGKLSFDGEFIYYQGYQYDRESDLIITLNVEGLSLKIWIIIFASCFGGLAVIAIVLAVIVKSVEKSKKKKSKAEKKEEKDDKTEPTPVESEKAALPSFSPSYNNVHYTKEWREYLPDYQTSTVEMDIEIKK